MRRKEASKSAGNKIVKQHQTTCTNYVLTVIINSGSDGKYGWQCNRAHEPVRCPHYRCTADQITKVDVLLFGVSQADDAVLAVNRPANQIIFADAELVIRHVKLKQECNT